MLVAICSGKAVVPNGGGLRILWMKALSFQTVPLSTSALARCIASDYMTHSAISSLPAACALGGGIEINMAAMIPPHAWHLRFWGCGGIKCELRRPSAIEPLDCHRQTDGHLSGLPGISVVRAQFAMRVSEARTSAAENDAVDPLYQCGERGSKTPVKAG